MPQPINAIRTRVVKDSEGLLWVIASTDGLNWFTTHLRGYGPDSQKTAIDHADDIVRWSRGIVPEGQTIWKSE